MTNPVALIAGGGIAGTVAALALHRAGWAPRVFEARAADADERGAFLTVAVNGLTALRALDLDPSAVLAAGFPTPALTMTNGAGRHLGVLPLGGPAPDGTTTTTIRRADLYAALRAAAQARGIPLSYGKALRDFTEGPGGVSVTLADGSTAQGSLLVGADGIRSRTRELLDPDGPAPDYLGLLNAGGFTSGPVDGVTPEPGMVYMAFGRRAFFGWTAAPDGSVWWFANPPSKQPVRPGDFTSASWRDHLLGLFADDAFPAAAIIRATPDVLGPWNTDDLPRVRVWHSRRAVLIGDAAHAVAPSSGQGASMAFEDAVTLGLCLPAGSSVAEGLADYEQRRRRRVERVVAVGRRNGSGKTAGPVGAAIRDAMFPLVMKILYRRGNPQAWILDHRVA
ncbi:FAD-dependent oxidoreductase [Paractinoplanes abujensis]|uniref:2-polyprenyl-6-methoxyphenol hydroxylase-like FAD-dependent oxidoreductase n=1 Tax=Paractinoplanes abujensis TaxID=882441 RepID=A0A7W7G5L4_9ACTN|nr:NAD(P)/FAD-dependent oxidoreductase [Actinoplanes abujensis]MBB4697117.1 2-polyprenyl-6-methoxyphenol hydroxylase-like FAD-dependent oxidoreductase [Actinoplanes abujensis]GID18409.1 FAD-dependent oxidoreductase [Actinoplanes abujensis]